MIYTVELVISDIISPNLGFLDILVSLANIILLIGLFYIYWDSYKKVKSQFTIGLMLFATLLLLQNFLFSSFLLFHKAFRVPEIDLPLFLLNITEFFALVVLLKITNE